ncbi:Protein of unknown function [Gryllus bimaculatus]|nr:Protein of unknown function [Gryllus bimaculatus]
MEINSILQNMKDVVAAFKQEVIRRQLDICLLEKRCCVRAVESEYFFEEGFLKFYLKASSEIYVCYCDLNDISSVT